MTREEVVEILHYYRDLDREVKLIEEQIARLGQPYAHISAERQRLLNRKSEIAWEKKAITQEIDRLRINEKVVIYEFYVLEKEWRQIARGINYSISQCKNIRAEALEKLGRGFEHNKVIGEIKGRMIE